MMGKLLIVIANESLARIFTCISLGEPLLALHTIDFPGGRPPSHLLPQALQSPVVDSSKESLEQFACELSQHLKSVLNDKIYDAVWIAASNPIRQVLKGRFGQNVECKHEWICDDDLTHLNIHSLEIKLRDLKSISSKSAGPHCLGRDL